MEEKLNNRNRSTSDKGISFNSEMIKSIIDGSKSVTLVKVPEWSKKNPDDDSVKGFWKQYLDRDGKDYIKDYNFSCCWFTEDEYIKSVSKYQVGDILYVRESFGSQIRHGGSFIAYRSDGKDQTHFDVDKNGSYSFGHVKWKAASKMDEKYSRLSLKIGKIEIQKLCDISEHDISNTGFSSKEALMNSIEHRYSGVSDKDWFWVYTFEKITK